MSLFENEGYQWRETYFVLLRAADRPKADQVVTCLKQGTEQYQIADVLADTDGGFESLTLHSPDDFSAMDVTYVTGEEVTEQIDELIREIMKSTLSDDDRKKLMWLQQCDSRLDVYHFENVAAEPDAEDEYLDPGSLIIVLRRLAKLCHGVGVDPQSGTLM
jgi:hypothetical protein